jgi:cell wall-associated NlpC family hydrolase
MYDKYLSYSGFEPQAADGPDAGQASGQKNQRESLVEKGNTETPEKAPAKSSAQQAREMKKKADKGQDSDKLAGADNNSHQRKQAEADKNYKHRDWSPDERVDFIRGYVGSKEYSLEAEIDQFKKGTNKCNKFVSDVLEKSGAKVPQIGGILEGDPPSARNWANKGLNIEGYETVDDPRSGDVAAFNGHVGIVTDDGKTISASTKEDKIVENDWGFRTYQKGKVTFRRYVGKKE